MPIHYEYGRDGQVTCSNRQGLEFYLLGQPTKLTATFVPGTSLTSTSQGHNRVTTVLAR